MADRDVTQMLDANTTPDWLRYRAQTNPERLALICGDDRLTFRQLDALVDGACAVLAKESVQTAEIIGLLARNSTGFVIAAHALARLGAVLMPLNLRLTTPELAWQLRDAGAHRLLHDKAHRETAVALRGETPPLQLISIEGLRPVGASHASPLQEGPFDLSNTHSIVYTSGTTGRPKGAILTYGNHFWSAIGSALNLGVQAEDRWLACLPLFHVGGLAILLRGAIYGTTAVIHDRFDPAEVNASIEQDHITIISVVANMLERMLDERNDRRYPDHLRCVLLGGGPAPETLLRRCADLGVPVTQTYGLTETASQVATLSPEDVLPKLGSAGRPLFGAELRIEGPDGAEQPAGGAGEIVVRGPSITAGYLNHPDATAAAIRDGWLHTGDIGYLDPEGYLYVLDRRDDLIVSGGENVYPAEVEAVLQAHPDVSQAGVFGVQDPRWGQAPVAIVVLRAGATATSDSLAAHCRGHLAAYKTPSRIEFRDELPRTASGKLVRSRLASLL